MKPTQASGVATPIGSRVRSTTASYTLANHLNFCGQNLKKDTAKDGDSFTASTLDQMPKHVACGLMYGSPFSIPVPDLDRTDHLLVLGSNIVVSAPRATHVTSRLEALDLLVVCDVVMSETAATSA